MFLFATTQAIAASRSKQRQGKRQPNEQRGAARPSTRKPLFSRVLEALVVSRMNRAKIEIDYQRRLREGSTDK
jgi:hypothetical protein